MMEFAKLINYTYIERAITPTVCNTGLKDILYYFFIPVLILIGLLLILYFKETIRKHFNFMLLKRGYIKILLIQNKRIKFVKVKLDKFNRFVIGKGKNKRSYTREMLKEFLLGYDNENFPVYAYDFNFILPLTITKKKLEQEIRKQLDTPLTEKEISAFEMKIDSQILNTVYDRKLISDLYSISKPSFFEGKMLWIIIGAVVLLFLYWTGYLTQILQYLGVVPK